MRWDVSVANSLGIMGSLGAWNPYQVSANAQTTWSSTFGMDVSEAITTDSHRSLNVTAHVLPSFYGLCYRQLSRYEREVDVVYHNACGASAVVGTAVLEDWGWGFDVATGPECAPPSNLPSAATFE
jgi:hypothetical protein